MSWVLNQHLQHLHPKYLMWKIYFSLLLLLYFILEGVSDSPCSYNVME